jgi:formylglycine-generating enzyme required for sulfatase activity
MRCPVRLWLLPALCAALALPLAGGADKPKGKKYALLVGVKAYEHDKLPDLKYAENDVEELARVLQGKQAGFQGVTVLTTARGEEEEGARPTAKNIRAELKKILEKATKHDTVLIALSGHGVQLQVQEGKDAKKERDEAFFCPCDARLTRSKDPAELGKTLISFKELFDQLDDSGAGAKLLLVDACRAAPKSGRSLDPDSLPRLPRNTAGLFSCASGQKSYESDKLGKGQGVFFHFVLEGLRGKAKNSKGEVTWDRLAEHVKEAVSDQVPALLGGEASQSPLRLENLAGKSPVLAAGAPDQTKVELAKDLTNSLKMQLKLIPAGKFMMGSPRDEEGRGKDEQQHEVQISKPFYLAIHAVTVGQFRRFVEETDYETDAEKDGKGGWGYNAETRRSEGRKKEYTWKNPGWKQTDDHPVVNVSWNDAVQFCAWLSKKERVTYRLPTEAEWEYACRAGTTTRFHPGDEDRDLKGYANLADQSLKAKLDAKVHAKKAFVDWDDKHPFTAPVGSYKPNAWGLYDVHGNVWEWCHDWYQKDYYKDSPKKDPSGPAFGLTRVLRGGAWFDSPGNCRAATRTDLTPAGRGDSSGFRVVRVASTGTP